MNAPDSEPFIHTIRVPAERVTEPEQYPFSLPAVRALDGLALAPVTYLVGENGSGKSTVLEAIAVAAGFNAEGGSSNLRFSTRKSESSLNQAIRLVRGARRPRTGFFLRAESFFNVATELENMPNGLESYGGRSLHEQSHGESFLALVNHRFGPDGLYILDEPEAALSPSRQLSLLSRMHELLKLGSQFIIATHSPIVLAYPGATIYQLSSTGVANVPYEDLEHVTLTRSFLDNRAQFLQHLFDDEPEE